jgi:hypothetical protein
MIVFIDESTISSMVERYGSENMLLFNLTGFREGFDPLRILPGDRSIFYQGGERVSDVLLLNYIYNSDVIFFEFFSKIIYPFYCGLDIVIIVHSGGIYDEVTESVMKIIQQRYGYNCSQVITEDDLDYIDRDSSMDINGIYNFDIDKQRYLGLNARAEGVPKSNMDNAHFEDIADNLLKY